MIIKRKSQLIFMFCLYLEHWNMVHMHSFIHLKTIFLIIETQKLHFYTCGVLVISFRFSGIGMISGDYSLSLSFFFS